jgi:O-antigen/teichoic acid export membrane protein
MDKTNSPNLAPVSSKNVLINSIWKFIATFITKSGALIFVILLARFLSPEGFGLYNLAMSVVLTLTLITDIGINNTLLRYVSFSLGKGNNKKAAAYTRYLFKLKFMLTIIISLALFSLSYPLSIFIFKKQEIFFPLIILSFYLVILSLENFLEYLFFAVKKVQFLTIKELILQTLRISFAFLVFVFLKGYNQLLGIFLSILLAQLVIFFFLYFVLKVKYSFLFFEEKESINKKEIFSFIRYLAVGNFSNMFFAYIDVIMLGIFLSSVYVGYYSAAVTLIGSLVAFVTVSNILLPLFAQINKSQLNYSYERVFKYACIISIPMVFGSFALGKYFIRLFYGLDYLPAVLPFYFLIPVIFFGIISDTLISLFSARAKPKYFASMLVLTALLNIILNYFLITLLLRVSSNWAMAGAAIATLVSRFFYFGSLFILARKKLKIDFNLASFIKPFFSGLIMFFIIFYINNLLQDMTLLLGVIEIIVGALIYFVLLYFFGGIGNAERNLIRSLFYKQLKKDTK